MPPSRDYTDYGKVYFRPEMKNCPICVSMLKRSHAAWSLGVQTMKVNIHATSYPYRCSSMDCGGMSKSAEAEALSLPFRTYALDVVVENGCLRHNGKRSIAEIHRELRSAGIEICGRECYELPHVFEELLAVRPVELDPDFYDAVVQNGGIVLAIDGVQPERGNSTLYVLQDVLTGKVFNADYLVNSISENVSKLIDAVRDKLKKAGLDIVAVISDHQHSIRLAVAASLPGVPHQFCHFHVLRNACLPVTDMDRQLKKDVRKRIRGIEPVERALSRRDDASAREAANACLLLRSLLICPGTISLNFGGMKVFEHLTALDGALHRMLAFRKDREIERLSAITGGWCVMEAQYRDVGAPPAYADRLRSMLAGDGSADSIRRGVGRFFSSVRRKAAEGINFSMLDAMVRTLESHRDGLFHCYADSRIPRTDNGLEITIRRLKTGYGRTSGRKSCDSFMAQYGRSVFMIPLDVPRSTLPGMAESADREKFGASWKEFNSRRPEQSLMRVPRLITMLH